MYYVFATHNSLWSQKSSNILPSAFLFPIPYPSCRLYLQILPHISQHDHWNLPIPTPIHLRFPYSTHAPFPHKTSPSQHLAFLFMMHTHILFSPPLLQTRIYGPWLCHTFFWPLLRSRTVLLLPTYPHLHSYHHFHTTVMIKNTANTARSVKGSIPCPVKSDAVSPTARHRCDVSVFAEITAPLASRFGVIPRVLWRFDF